MFRLFIFTLCFLLIGNNLQAQQPFSIGVTHTIASSTLGEERTLNVYLPVNYSDTSVYPIIYLLDGSADEDFVHVSGVLQFFNLQQMIPEAIIVGIANVDRKRDFCFPTTIEQDKIDFPTTGGSEKFIQFLEQEVIPFIEKTYPENGSKTLIGQSLGGLLATEILFKKPQLFNQYLIVSPSLWWDNESLLNLSDKAMEQLPSNNMKIFIAVGKEHKVMVRDAKKLYRIIKQADKNNVEVQFRYLKNEDHATILHNATYAGLLWLFGNK